MKRMKFCMGRIFLLSMFVLILSSVNPINAKAKAIYDKVVEINMISRNHTDPINQIMVEMDNNYEHIANVKSSSRFLKAVIGSSNKNPEGYNNLEDIQLNATKKGTYKVSFDIVDDYGNFRTSEEVKVIVSTVKESYKGFKYIKIGKKNILKRCIKDEYTREYVTIKKAAPVNVKMKKGYKLLGMKIYRNVKSSIKTTAGATIDNLVYRYEDIGNGTMLRLSEGGPNNLVYKERKGNKSVQYNDSIFGYTYLYIDYLDNKGNKRSNYIVIRSRI